MGISYKKFGQMYKAIELNKVLPLKGSEVNENEEVDYQAW